MGSLTQISCISHTLDAAVFLLDPWTKQSVKKQALLSMSFAKTCIKFLDPTLNKCQLVSLIFWTSSVYHRMDKSCFNSHSQKNFISKSCSPVTKFPRNVFLFHSQNIGSCDREWNITGENVVWLVGQRVCILQDRGLYCCVWQRLPNLW